MLDLSNLRAAVRSEGGVSRRLFLAYGAALAAIPSLDLRVEGRVLRRAPLAGDPFTLGVASGEPTETGVVLWTRLAPNPLVDGGGMPRENLEVTWEVADDEGMKNVVRHGTAVATPQLAHSVHVEVEGLKPDHWYFYRFRTGDATSPVGRTRTTPERASIPEKLRLAFASCQHWEQGLFTAYEHMAKDDLDLVFHLGDYIYEYAGRDKLVRKHHGKKLASLEDYRARHAQYRTDRLLQVMHARCPWVVTWDDHEFENNYANDISERKGVDPAAFLEIRANAYQAYYEMMPLRRKSVPQGPNMKIYRTLPYGRLAEFQVLDTRQYRTDQPNGDKPAELNDDALNPKNTILGAEQAGWLKGALLRSPATWNVLAQQVMMGMVDTAAGEPKKYSMDQWPGYAHERMKLVQFLADRKVPNPVILSGDIHSNWVNDLRVDDRKAEAPVVATEFVGTSITTGGNGPVEPKNHDSILAENPCVKFYDRQRGYVRCVVTPKSWRSEYVVVADVTKPGAPAVEKAAFVVEAGAAGVKKA
ncbi:alkaline phosphatase D family protein [Fimbriiglobus ruber]|uniref:Phosphodiesterase/alkaline phosphatase D n=1 Tax=Fimbriiglobus ruber TaxID=1908690 RepID=A0A225DU65_9BACT|nr:alkaline phosphatase D family protein [Fimbriiglobus ruber]OWK39667.1 phosphodiesterase/alkaline phosphatase D [Fimbriiglobus ruber]